MTANWKEKVGGYKPSEVDPRDYRFSNVYKAIKLPETFNVDVKYNVHNQEEYNNCAAHALASCFEILLKDKNKFKEISFPWYYGNRRHTEHKGEGLVSRDLLKTVQKDGSLHLSDYPKIEEMVKAMETFDSNYSNFKTKALDFRLGNYYQCNTIQEVKEAIYKYGYCMIGTLLFESFGKVARGETLYMNDPIVTGNGNSSSIEDVVGGHMMIATGWIKDYLIIQNSWGEEFGDKGYFYMPYTLSTWNDRTGFPISVFEAWAIDGFYVDGKFTTLESETPVDPPKPPVSNDGWYKVDGDIWRYKENGKDVTAWKKINNLWYYFESNGNMTTNKWAESNKHWCYLKPNGNMAIGWFRVDNRWYWADENGYCVTGYKTIDNKNYYFAEASFNQVKECQMILTDTNGAII